MERFKHITGHSPTTAQLIQFLRDRATGPDTVTDEELRQACGRDCAPGGNGYSYLSSALRFLTRTDRVVWRRIAKANAIKRLSDAETAELLSGRVKQIRRVSHKATHEATCLDVTKLGNEERKRVFTNTAIIGMIGQFADGGMQKFIEARNVEAKQIEFDAKKALEQQFGK